MVVAAAAAGDARKGQQECGPESMPDLLFLA